MNEKNITAISKFLSFILRHQPEAIGVTMDTQGWVNIEELIAKSSQQALPTKLSQELIELVVATNDKRRFAISPDGRAIRANQGHSIDIDLALEPVQPPQTLLHGTAHQSLEAILQRGLQKRQRHHVHLSESSTVATSVGARYGKPVLLTIASEKMHQDGFSFFLTDNKVWLVESVPPQYITVMDKEV